MIKTDYNGYIPIQNIKSGEIINRQEVIRISSSISNKNIVKLSKNCFGLNKPNQDLYVTDNHLILEPKTDKLVFSRKLINNKKISLYSSNKNNKFIIFYLKNGC